MWLRRAAATSSVRSREREGEEGDRDGGRNTGEWERGRGGRVASPGRRGGAKQAGREEVAGARGRARRACARPPGREEDERGGVEMGWAGFCSRPHR